LVPENQNAKKEGRGKRSALAATAYRGFGPTTQSLRRRCFFFRSANRTLDRFAQVLIRLLQIAFVNLHEKMSI
jgi:hypothetical protein